MRRSWRFWALSLVVVVSSVQAQITDINDNREWWGDGFTGYVTAGLANCVPKVPASSLTIPAFACRGYVVDNGRWHGINQPASPIGPLNAGDGTYWLLLYRDPFSTVSGWTFTGSYYRWQFSATRPLPVEGGVLFGQVGVAGGVITTAKGIAPRAPEQQSRGGSFNVVQFGATPDDSTNDDSFAFQAALEALDARGGEILVSSPGTYHIKSTITWPAQDPDGSKIRLRCHPEARLQNEAPANNPTIAILGPDAPGLIRNWSITGCTFVGLSTFPNHALHVRFTVQWEVTDNTFVAHGAGIYSDGGLFQGVIRENKFWPSTKKHGSDLVHQGTSNIFFDTPVQDAAFINTMTIADNTFEGGKDAVELVTGYGNGVIGLVITGNLWEGLSAPGWGANMGSMQGGLFAGNYAEFNSGGQAGDPNDRHLRLNDAQNVTIIGDTGTGKVEIRNSVGITIMGIRTNNLDVDNTNNAVYCFNCLDSIASGGGGAGFTFAPINPILLGAKGGGAIPRDFEILSLKMTPQNHATAPNVLAWLPGLAMPPLVSNNTGAIIVKDQTDLLVTDVAGTDISQGMLFQRVSLVDTGTHDLGGRPTGMLRILSDSDEYCEFAVRGGANAVTLLQDGNPTSCTITQGTANAINLYPSGGTTYIIENRRGATLSLFLIGFFGKQG